MKNKVVASDLLEERQKIDFDQQEVGEWLYNGKEGLNRYNSYCEIIQNDPILRNSEEFFDLTRTEQMMVLKKKTQRIAEVVGTESLMFTMGAWPITNHFIGLVRNVCDSKGSHRSPLDNVLFHD